MENAEHSSVEERVAAAEKAIGILEAESKILRERYHDNIAPILQRLIIQSEDFAKSLTKFEISIAAMAAAFTGTVEKLDGHVKSCTESGKTADTHRRNFRKEMRGYFVTLIVAAVGYYLSQKYHFSIGVAP